MPEKPKKKTNGRDAIIVVAIGIILFGAAAIWASSGSSDEAPKTTFNASMTKSEPINPATATFDALVQNTGSDAASPTCMVSMSDTSGTYKGFDTFTFEKVLQPGEKWGFKGQLTITKEGAAYITEGSVKCT